MTGFPSPIAQPIRVSEDVLEDLRRTFRGRRGEPAAAEGVSAR
jgi:hypothetical protein